MLTYTPIDPPTSSGASACSLRGNPLDGSVGPVNVGEVERYGSLIGGAALVAAGLSRRSLPGLLLAAAGGLFIVRGLGGHCRLYDSIGVSTSSPSRSGVPDHTGHKVESSIVIDRPAWEIFRFWRDLGNIPAFMESVRSVRELGEGRSHWVVNGPGGRALEWDAEIVNEHPGEMISWQTLPGADVQSAGTVRFTPATEESGTRVRVVLEFHPPAGAVGARIARFLGHDPAFQLARDLARLKHLMESRPGAPSAA